MKFIFLLIFYSSISFSQENPIAPAPSEDSFEKVKQDRLLRIRGELVQLQNEIFNLKETVKNTSDSVEKFKAEVKLGRLLKEEGKKRLEFIETSTNINIKIHEENIQKDKSTLSENIQAVLQPAFDGLRAISERPRKIQELTDKEDKYRADLENLNIALEELKLQLKNNKDPKLTNTFRKSILMTNDEIRKVEILIEDAHFKLLKLENDKGSIVTSFSKAIFEFLKTKGKNLILALLVFTFIFWLLKLGKNKFIEVILRQKNKNATEQVTWIIRPIRVIYSTVTILFALSMAVLTLYVLDDWVLVTIIIFVISSIIWSSRTYLPNFIEISKVVLNLGSIREGERIIFDGLAWKIKSLGYYTRLTNPSLKGGELRVNTKELLRHNSRPVNQTEPWFPTEENDWVIINGNEFGKVVMQTPEQVSLKLIGGQIKYFKTMDYLSKSPMNLSNGFGIELIFGIDYDHQKKITDDFLSLFKSEYPKRINEYLSGLKEDFKEINIEFHSAGESSLNYRFFLRCNGKLASQKRFIERRVQKIFVEICNDNELTIPFNQIRVHMSKNE